LLTPLQLGTSLAIPLSAPAPITKTATTTNESLKSTAPYILDKAVVDPSRASAPEALLPPAGSTAPIDKALVPERGPPQQGMLPARGVPQQAIMPERGPPQQAKRGPPQQANVSAEPTTVARPPIALHIYIYINTYI